MYQVGLTHTASLGWCVLLRLTPNRKISHYNVAIFTMVKTSNSRYQKFFFYIVDSIAPALEYMNRKNKLIPASVFCQNAISIKVYANVVIIYSYRVIQWDK